MKKIFVYAFSHSLVMVEDFGHRFPSEWAYHHPETWYFNLYGKNTITLSNPVKLLKREYVNFHVKEAVRFITPQGEIVIIEHNYLK